MALSALTGEGTEGLLAIIDAELARRRHPLSVQVPLDDGETIAWLYRRGEVLAREDGDTSAHRHGAARCRRYRAS